MEEIIGLFIAKYRNRMKHMRKMLKSKRIQHFAQFYVSSLDKYKEDKTKYARLRTLGLKYIMDHQDDILAQLDT